MRSFLSGFTAGVVVKILCTAAFTLLLAGILGNAPAQRAGPDGLWPPFSGEWFAARGLVLIGAVLAGVAASHWSRPGSWAAPLALAAVWLVWSVSTVDAGQPVGALAVRLLVSPVGILIGALAYRRWKRVSDA